MTGDEQPRVESDPERGLVLVVFPVSDARRLALLLLRRAAEADRRRTA